MCEFFSPVQWQNWTNRLQLGAYDKVLPNITSHLFKKHTVFELLHLQILILNFFGNVPKMAKDIKNVKQRPEKNEISTFKLGFLKVVKPLQKNTLQINFLPNLHL